MSPDDCLGTLVQNRETEMLCITNIDINLAFVCWNRGCTGKAFDMGRLSD
jgi:hypothetical protein